MRFGRLVASIKLAAHFARPDSSCRIVRPAQEEIPL
jgi:hypothetical protein